MIFAHDRSSFLSRIAFSLVGLLSFVTLFVPAYTDATSTVIFITTTGASTWQVPSDWTGTNSIEVIGGGGGSLDSNDSTFSNKTGGGGGGGAYSKVTNVSLTPGATVDIFVGAGGTKANGGGGGNGGDTYLCNSTSNCTSISDTAVIVGAKGGTGAPTSGAGGAGGTSSSGVGTTKYSGGNGGAGNLSNGSAKAQGGAGGGGAAGPNGAGGNGGDSFSVSYTSSIDVGGGGGGSGGGTNGAVPAAGGTTGGAGGNNSSGTGGGVAGVANVSVAQNGANGGGGGGGAFGSPTGVDQGGNGGAGIEWDSSHGSGGGGGGEGGFFDSTYTGGNGALYGGGGGGGSALDSNINSAPGAQGIIVITYTPQVVVAPTVGTSAASSVATSTVTLDGSITATGGQDATQSGFAYGTSATLSSVIATSTLGSQTGATSFTQNLTGLTPNTTYYYRAYATNGTGTGYGSIVSFTTQPAPPTLTTSSASSISETTATLSASITDTGGEDATQSGFTYGTDPLLETVIATSTLGAQTGATSFNTSVSSLTASTVYYARAYATNGGGTSYGSIVSFTTSPPPVATPAPVFHPSSSHQHAPATISTSNTSSSAGFSDSSVSSLLNTLVSLGVITQTQAETALANVSVPRAPASAPVSISVSTPNLTQGSSSSSVKALQIFLNESGYAVSTTGVGSAGNETDYFGPATKAALIRFQRANGIPATGYFGPLTRAAITATK